MRIIDNLKVKGKSIPVTIYEIFDADPIELFNLKEKTLSIFTTGFGLFKDKKYYEKSDWAYSGEL